MINKKVSLRAMKYGLLILSSVFAMTSCLGSGDETMILETGNSTGIPSDSKADPNPNIGNPTTNIPNIQYTAEQDGKYTIIRLDMTGVQNPETLEWLRLFGTGGSGNEAQNVWVEVDGIPKGISVHNTIDDADNGQKAMNDVIFLVDNSGSMDAEADAIARDIISWAQKLSATSDVRFGCVGYNGIINGALNITTYNEISNYLNRGTGTSRTIGFEGQDANELLSYAPNYSLESQEECGTAALRFADEHFSFRRGANRVYINFTDEPNQPHGISGFSVEYVNNQNNWDTSKGTIHTVFSDSKYFTETSYEEYPWKMSEYTGGTVLYTSSDFSGVSLESLPVTGAIQNSYIIRFTNVDQFMDGKPHKVTITILSDDGSVKAEKEFYVIFGTKE